MIRALTKVDYKLLYIDLNTNEIHLTSVIEDEAKNEFYKVREEYKRKNETKKEFTVIPIKKFPPLKQSVEIKNHINLCKENNEIIFDIQINDNNNNINNFEEIKQLKNENNKLNKEIIDLNNKIKQLFNSNKKLNEEVKK